MTSGLLKRDPQHSTQQWLIIALANFLIAAFLGTLLRYAFVTEVDWAPYKYILHAHSHMAMLGWVFPALYALLIHAFVPGEKRRSRFYSVLFWITEGTLIGMLVSFLLEGYGPIAITFLALQTVCAYAYIFRFWKDLPSTVLFSKTLIKTAFIFFIVSTAGLLTIGPIIAMGLRGSAVYYMAVQFYLHYQFNGWFLFAVLALLFRVIELQGITLPAKRLRAFYFLLVSACILTYALAVAWSQPYLSIFLVNSLGVLLQLSALSVFLLIIWQVRKQILHQFQGITGILLRLALFSFVMKILVQACLVLPVMARVGYTIRNFVIGFIHLITLGAVTLFILAYALRANQISMHRHISIWGIWCVLGGFVLTETVLFLQGILFWAAAGFLPYYYELLFGVTAIIPLGIFCMLIGQNLRTGFSNHY